MKKILLSLSLSTLLFSSITTEKYELTTGIDSKTNLSTPVVLKYSGNKNNAHIFTVSTEEKDAAEINTKFNCSTGDIDIDASVLDIPRELQNQFNTLFKDTDSIIKELAYQELTEFLLDEMAKIHYNMSKEAGGDALKAFDGISMAYTEQCIASTIDKSIELSLEGGVGLSVYDLFSGKFGINATELMGITKCLRNSEYDSLDDKDKERFEDSKRWVRHLFYKILNESFDIDINNNITADCKEWDIQKNKKDEIGYNIACKGVFTDLLGNKTNVSVTGEQVAVGTKKTSFKEQTEKGSDDSKKAKLDKQVKKDSDLDTSRVLKSSSIEYEGVLTKTPSFSVSKNTIDILDFSPEERLTFNLYIFKKAKNLINNQKTTSKKIKEASIEAIRRLLSINKLNESVFLKYKCAYIGTPQDSCKMQDFPLIKVDNTTQLREEVKRLYESELKEKALYYNYLSTGLVSLEDKERVKEQILYKEGENYSANSFKKELLLSSRKNLDMWNMIKGFVFAGSQQIFLNEYSHYDLDTLNLMKYINNNVSKINNGLILLNQPHELDMARILFNYSRNIVNVKILLATKTSNKSYTISQNASDINNNFIYLDYNNQYILSKSYKQYFNIDTKELEEITNNIRLVKNLYVSEYIEVLSRRMDAIRAWLYSFQKRNYNMNAAMLQLQKLNLKKIELKIEQRKRILKEIRD